MAIPLHVFREYDIRGLVATELTPEFAGQLGRGFGQYLLEKNIVIGFVTRSAAPAPYGHDAPVVELTGRSGAR
jgi:phosphomannomutase